MPKTKTAIPAFLSAALLLAALPLAAADVSGVWILTMQSPMGERVMDATFAQKDGTLKVSWTSAQGSEIKGEGTVKGQDIEWKMSISMPGGDIELQFKGKIDGEKMTGEILMGDAGTASWSAKRKN